MNSPNFKIAWIVFIVLIANLCELQAQIVVVVNPENPLTDLSLDELQLIYSGKISNYENGEEIVLTQTEGYSKLFYEVVLNKSPNKVLKYWLNLVFSGVSVTPPKECRSVEEAMRTIHDNIGAIGFIEYSLVDDRVKTITLNKKHPSTSGYPFGNN